MKTLSKSDFIDSKQAFNEAIEKEILSAKESDPNFAGNFMYMHSKEDIHYFKNINTRKYGHDKETISKSL
jgi:hypothetical protein